MLLNKKELSESYWVVLIRIKPFTWETVGERFPNAARAFAYGTWFLRDKVIWKVKGI